MFVDGAILGNLRKDQWLESSFFVERFQRLPGAELDKVEVREDASTRFNEVQVCIWTFAEIVKLSE